MLRVKAFAQRVFVTDVGATLTTAAVFHSERPGAIGRW